jgi:hypothetical protein
MSNSNSCLQRSIRETSAVYKKFSGSFGFACRKCSKTQVYISIWPVFKSSWKKPYSDRILEKCSEIAGLAHTVSPHQLRHFLFTWLKKKGIDDGLIQPYSGHENRAS